MEQGVHKDLHFLGKFHHNPEYEEKVFAGDDDIQKKNIHSVVISEHGGAVDDPAIYISNILVPLHLKDTDENLGPEAYIYKMYMKSMTILFIDPF